MKPTTTYHKRLGIAGGMGTHAGLWLMQRIVQLCGPREDQDYPEIVLHNNSRIPDRTRAIVQGETSPLNELVRTIELFNKGGVEVAMLACMTAHFYYDSLQKQFSGTLLNAVDITIAALQQQEKTVKGKIGLIGSTGLIRSGIFQQKLMPLGYEVMVLTDAEQEQYFMGPIYRRGGIKSGVTNGAPKNDFLKQLDILGNRGCEAVIGACSEFPLVVNDENDFPVIDAFDLLAARAVEHCNNCN